LRHRSSLAPWNRAQAIVLVVVVVLAAFMLGLSWWGAAEEVRLARQFRWVAGGVLSIIVLGVVSATWILEGRRAVSRRRRRWMAEQRRRLGAVAPVSAVPALVAGDRMTRYHRTGCDLVAGKSLIAASRLDHEREGRRPCGVCRPETGEPADPEPSREAVRA
jgi:hypothetical protein